jgi:large subunit ribosomal protein L25
LTPGLPDRQSVKTMKSLLLNVYPRTQTGRNRLKSIRARERVPAVIYGRHNPPQNLEVSQQELDKLISHSASENVLVDLTVEGDARGKRLALVQEVQHHVLSGKVLHLDFHEVAENEKVTVTVPVETTGEAAGVKTGGGVLEHVLFKVKLRGLPKDLPEVITVDVTPLEIGQTIHLKDIPLPAEVEVLGDKRIPVISVAAPLTEEQEAAEAATQTEAGAEPEVIREKKEEGEEAPVAGKPAAKGEAKGAEKGTERAGDKSPEKKGAEKKK